MIKAKYSRKALIALSILAVLSQLAVLPAFSESKMSFYSEFSGIVKDATTLPPLNNDKLLKVLLVTEGTITECLVADEPLFPVGVLVSVIISEKMTVHKPEGDGLSVGSFTVGSDPNQIYVSFTAKVSGMFHFEGKYRIVGGTGIFEKVRGYGTIVGVATPISTKTFVGSTVEGSVEGYIWGLPG